MAKILVVGSFAYEMYAPAFYRAWQEMGHDVIKIDNDKYIVPGQNLFSLFLNKFQDKYHYGFPQLKYNNDIIKTVETFQPDLVFLYRCNHVFNRTLRRIRSNTIIFSYNNDDPFSERENSLYAGNFIGNSKYCDLVYVYRKKNMDDFSRIGIHHTKLLLPYYLTTTNYEIKDTKKDIPVAFVGHYEDDGRDDTIRMLYDAGIPVTIYGGDYWITKSKLYSQLKPIIKEPKSGAAYNELLNRMQIALVFLSQRNSDKYTRRCFEIPAAKTLMLAPYTKELDELFPEDKCAVYYRSTEDLIEKCKYLLINPDVIDKIANAGYERLSIIGGSEIDRCLEIIRDYENIKKS